MLWEVVFDGFDFIIVGKIEILFCVYVLKFGFKGLD